MKNIVISWSFLISTYLSSDSRAAVTALPAACDESKCRAKRIHPWVEGETEHTCWVPLDVNVTDDPLTFCSDGYEGRTIDNMLPEEREGKLHQWITCCPPRYNDTVMQQCSDKACSSPDWEGGGNCWADGFQEPMTCSSSEFRYPRSTGLMSLIYVQYICCNSPSSQWIMEELLVARIIWMTLSGITFCACLILVLGVMFSRKARSQGYNLYLVFLAIPDAIANLFILIRNGLTIPGVPVNPSVHIMLASVEYFYAAANMWLNGVIVYQIHYVLRKSNRYAKVAPPSVRKVCCQAAAIYAFSSLGFAWAFFLYYRGLVIFTLDQVVLIWILTRVVLVAPPLFYVTYVCFDVWRNRLLPKSGRTRVLSIYFLRVIIVFLLTWVPYFIIYEIAWNVTHSRWMVHVSYYLGSVQGTLSVLVALSKPDIKRAISRFLCCRCYRENAEEGSINISTLRGTTNPPTTLSMGGLVSGAESTTVADTCTAGVGSESSTYRGNDDIPEHPASNESIRQVGARPMRRASEWDREDVWKSEYIEGESRFMNFFPGRRSMQVVDLA